ncbi:MAG: hypothetical protein ACC634_09890, partial [Hyphomicrobiales bacterium]
MNLSSLSKAIWVSLVALGANILMLIVEELDISVNAFAEKGIDILVIAASMGAVYLIFKATKTVERIQETLVTVSNGDFEARIVGIDEKGNLGQLMWSINRLVDRADAYIRESSAAMTAVGENKYHRKILTGGMLGAFNRASGIINTTVGLIEERAGNFKAVTAQFEDRARASLKSLGDAATGLNETASGVDQNAKDTTEKATTVAAAAEEASVNVQTVASATEELTVSISEIRQQVARSTEVTEVTVAKIGEAQNSVSSLANAASRISGVIALITDIANQTNLL